LLNAITDVAKGVNNPLFAADPDSPAIRVFKP
jgi:putative ATP-dependent endonuclease of the OLD family